MGRPKELLTGVKILVTLERHLLEFLTRYRERHRLRSRSAAIRRIITERMLGDL